MSCCANWPAKDVVLDYPVGKILEKQIALFLVNVEREIANALRFETVDDRPCVHESAPTRINEHHAALSMRSRTDWSIK